jgi:hypothetical protein
MFPVPQPLGNTLRDWLAGYGITEAKANRWARKLWLRGCFCGSIRRWLNRQKWLHQIATGLGFRVRYVDAEIW